MVSYRNVTKGFNISAPGANTDFVDGTDTSITWGSDRAMRLSIQLATSAVVNVMLDRGGTEKTLGMNSNVALAAGALYVFDIHGLETSDTISFQVETDSVIDVISVDMVW